MNPIKIVSGILIGAVVLAALPFYPGFYDPVLPLRTFLLSLAIGGGGICLLRQKPGELAPFPSSSKIFTTFFMVLIIIGFISGIKSGVPQEGSKEVIRMALFFAWFFIVQRFFQHLPQSRLYIFRGLVVLAMGLSIVGLIQVAGGLKFLPGPHLPNATLYYRNLFGSALFLCIPFALRTLFLDSRKWRWIAGVALGLMLITMAFCRSGNAIIALLLFFPLFLYAYNRTRPEAPAPWKKVLFSPVLFLGLTLTLLITIFLVRFPGKTLKQRYRLAVPEVSRIETSSNSMQERTVLWQKSWEMVREGGFFGVGPGMWKVRIAEYGLIAKRVSYGDRFFVSPHNDWLQILCEYGLVGLLAWIGLFGVAVVQGLRTIRRSDHAPTRLEMGAWLYGLAGYMLISTFSYPGERMFHPVVLMLLFALILSSSIPQSTPQAQQKKTGVILIMGIWVLALFSGLEQCRVNYHLRQSRELQEFGKGKEALKYAIRADSKFVKFDPFTGAPVVLDQAILAAQEGDWTSASAAITEAEKFNCCHPQVYLWKGRIEAGGAHPEAAEKTYTEALARFPQFLQVRIPLIELKLEKGEYEAARILLEAGDFRYNRKDHRALRDRVFSGAR